MPVYDCPFCEIVSKGVPLHKRWIDWGTAVGFEPLNPVVPGHLLVVPTTHVEHFSQNPLVSAETMRCAAIMARGMGDCNLITSRGPAATQTVKHLHIHLVPRRAGDGLKLPWTGQK